MEACSFLEILSANRLARIVETYTHLSLFSLNPSFSFPQDLQFRISNLKFKDLVATPEGVQLSKDLVTGKFPRNFQLISQVLSICTPVKIHRWMR